MCNVGNNFVSECSCVLLVKASIRNVEWLSTKEKDVIIVEKEITRNTRNVRSDTNGQNVLMCLS